MPERVLEFEEHELRCGYASRSIQYSLRSDTLFVGCKDGTVTIVKNLAEKKLRGGRLDLTIQSERTPERSSEGKRWLPARALCEIYPGGLLIGRDGGTIDLLEWEQVNEKSGADLDFHSIRTAPAEGAESERVTYMEWLDKHQLLVSLRQAGTWIVKCGQPPDETSKVEWARRAFEAAWKEGPTAAFSGIQGIVGLVPLKIGREWLLTSQSGKIWVAKSDGRNFFVYEFESLWPSGEMPGFVTDFALVKFPSGGDESSFDYRVEMSNGAYVSTDSGIYLLRWVESGDLQPVRMSLPGLGRMATAITHCADRQMAFLWVSDSGGDTHLFSDEYKNIEQHLGAPNWRRSGVRHEASFAVLGAASWRTLAGCLVMGQVRRNDVVVICRYRMGWNSEEAQDGQGLHVYHLWATHEYLLHQGDPDKVLDYVKKAGDEVEKWEPEALLAELFEILGNEEASIRSLREFLGNPGKELARAFLKRLPKDSPPERYSLALRLWTHTLLGTIHRFAHPQKEAIYLGVIRWLRAISTLDLQLQSPEQAVAIQREVEEQIWFVRKWGIFGDSYARRRSAVVPLEVLDDKTNPGQSLELFTYQILLFQRQVDLEYEDGRGRLAGSAARDLKVRNVNGHFLVAVSWGRGGIRVYRMARESRALSGGYKLDVHLALEPHREEAGFKLRAITTESTRDAGQGFGHSRAIVLGQLPGEKSFYLLAAPAQPPDADDLSHFELWPLDVAYQEDQVTTHVASMKSPGGTHESVYSLLELEPGLVLAGLRGHGGTSQIALLKIEKGLKLRCLNPDPDSRNRLMPPSPEGRSITRNPIRALAQEQDGESSHNGSPHVVFAGCGDGQVWRLEIPRYAQAEDGFWMNPTPVDRLRAPVWALACRTISAKEGRLWRIFAGGADGTILAWQEIASGIEQKAKPQYTTLWATWEEDGSIARIHLLPENAAGEGSPPMALAVTQQGRCILFADRLDVEHTGRREENRRVRVPGERLGRPLLGATAFASEITDLPSPLIHNKAKDALTRLVCATNDGRLRFHTLHYPFHLEQREKEYRRLVALWLSMVKRTDDRTRFNERSLRLAEVAYIASPVAPQVLVRALLDTGESSHWKNAPKWDKSADRQWLPHHLRPLIDLRAPWESLDPEKARFSLEQALKRTWIKKDRELFVEIMTVVLQQSNRWLYQLAQSGDFDAMQVRRVYRSLLDGMETSSKRWFGYPYKAEIRTLASFANELTDGDTLWALDRASKSNPDGDLRRLLEERISAVRRLLQMGDLLLTLETVRAANLSLIRLCRRLVDEGGRSADDWNPDDPYQEMMWSNLENYVKALSDLPSTAFHLSQSVGDALAHEITRGFALSICACPSATIRIAHLMSEAYLVSPAHPKADRAAAVQLQFSLLAQLGVPVPLIAVRLFRWACSSALEELDILALMQSEYNENPDRLVGSSNLEVMQAYRPYQEIVRWIVDLAERLSSDASRIDLWKGRRLLERVERSTQKVLWHSRRFWHDSLQRFAQDVLGTSRAVDPSDRIQPEVILLSRLVKKWCENTLEDLSKRALEHQIFQPQLTLYRNVLERLLRAAAEFPNSTAIQKNIVLRVINHNLLEALDEHVLELEEVAQALDPHLVWEFRKSGRVSIERGGGDFARYLLKRSHEAENIPKNLRVLKGLLVPIEDIDFNVNYFNVENLFFDFISPDQHTMSKRGGPGWILKIGKSFALSPKEFWFLRLILLELDHNDLNFGFPLYQRKEPHHWPQVSTGCTKRDRRFIELRFSLNSDEENRLRLRKLQEYGLQNLYPRRDQLGTLSGGAGLYLANLAAAVVNWRLKIEKISYDEGWFQFLLEVA